MMTTHIKTRIHFNLFKKKVLTVLYPLRGLLACLSCFILLGVNVIPDGPFKRPHPAVWRFTFILSIVYELGLIFLLFQVNIVIIDIDDRFLYGCRKAYDVIYCSLLFSTHLCLNLFFCGILWFLREFLQLKKNIIRANSEYTGSGISTCYFSFIYYIIGPCPKEGYANPPPLRRGFVSAHCVCFM